MLSARLTLLKGLIAFVTAAILDPARAGELVTPPATNPPRVAPASQEGELAMRGFQLPDGFKVELIAAEPLLANPVAFDIDHQNRFWVAETFRLHAGVTDIRGKMSWLDEDLASRTADDRLAVMKRHEGANFPKYEESSERLKLILDTDGDGKADRSIVFAEGFNTALDGIASGVLARGGEVYFANVPNLWRLRDHDNDGVADERESLHFGYGVRVGFLGHDLHGLIMGPDGRLYFSMGDRGSNIEQEGRTIGDPDTGTVFRCNPDGSELEVFARGLRNPQELAFDQYGNLFTGDNNSDGGDRARLVYLVEGGDSGWTIGWQFIERPNARGPWNSEKMWHPQNEDQPAYIIPPIANLTDGPSGFAFNPGTGLPEKYRNHFFLVDFHGGKGSGIYSFRLEPRGAGFELINPEKFVWESLPTDVAFGLDGGIYFTDWVQGWGMTGKGRIYRVFHPETLQNPIIAETRQLLMSGMKQRAEDELAKLLAHVDMRVRQEAQFELASRSSAGVLAGVAKSGPTQLARIHAIWGLGQIARKSSDQRPGIAKGVLPLATDPDAEIRAQVARFMGEARWPGAVEQMIRLLEDQSPRVRMLAALSAGKLGDPRLGPAVIRLLAENAGVDPHVRHAGAVALAGINEAAVLREAARHESSAVRMGALLALRRLGRADVSYFLADADSRLVSEAARAINDLPINGAMRDLAELAGTADLAGFQQDLLRRVVNANLRVGTRESARRVADVARNEALPEVVRSEALAALGNWENPSGRDQITGLWRPVAGARPVEHAVEAIQPGIAGLIESGPDQVRSSAARAAASLRLASAAEALLAAVRKPGAAGPRTEALRALAELKDARLGEAVAAAQADPSEQLRRVALRYQSQITPSDALAQIRRALESGTIGEKQSALGTLGAMREPAATAILTNWLGRLLKGEVASELEIDLIEAASRHDRAEIKASLEAREAQLARGDELAPFRAALRGGNADDGRRIFFERAEAQCARCHKVAGQGSEGGLAGPELTKIGAMKTREYLLESLLFPNKEIAEGFQSVLIVTKDGTTFVGIVTSENEQELVLESPEDGTVKVKKENIAAREAGLSSMPEGVTALLSPREIRDLVEYLSSLK